MGLTHCLQLEKGEGQGVMQVTKGGSIVFIAQVLWQQEAVCCLQVYGQNRQEVTCRFGEQQDKRPVAVAV